MEQLSTRLLSLADKVWLRLLSPSTMRLLAPVLGVAICFAGWGLWRLAGRTPFGRAVRWWTVAAGAALFATGVLYQLAAIPDDAEARAAAREALGDGLATRLPPSLALVGALAVVVAAVIAAWRWRQAATTPLERAELAQTWRSAARLVRPLAGVAVAVALAAGGAAVAAASGPAQVPAWPSVSSPARGTAEASLWVGTGAGLSRLVATESGPRWRGLARPHVPLPANQVTAVAGGPGGVVWIATHGGLARYSEAGGGAEWQTATVENAGLPYPTVLGLAIDRRGVAWAATGAGGAMIDRRPAGGPAEGRSLDGTTQAFTSLNAPLLHQILDAVYVDPQGRVWFGGAGGVNVYRPEEPGRPGEWLTGFNRYSTNGALPAHQVHTIFQDSKGRMWFGTPEGAATFLPSSDQFGLGAFDPARWQTFAPPGTALPDKVSVHAIAEDRHGRIYLGTKGGVAVLDEAQGDPQRRWREMGTAGPAGLPHPWVQALLLGPDGRVWAGTHGGLSVYDPARPQDGWQTYRAHPWRRWMGYLWPAHWEQNIINDDVTSLAWTKP